MKHRDKKTDFTITLLGETITPGPGTVPTSLASVPKTSIKDMISGLKKASRLGLFDTATK